MKIVFDFDHTLFSSKKRFNAFKSSFKKIGIKEKLFTETFEKSKGKGKFYDPGKHFDLIFKKQPNIERKTLEKKFESIIQRSLEFFYPDTIPFLKKWSRKTDLILLSFGEREFQKKAIKKSKIEKFFKKIVITKEVNKVKPFKEIFKKNEKIIFVEDNPDALLRVKKVYPDIITVRINRGEGKYKDLSDEKEIDFSISNLKQLDEILTAVQKKPECLLLFSGGLDSILAAKILMEQGVKTKGITFKSDFFGVNQAKEMAKKINLPLKVIDFSKEYLKIVKNPKYGYGKGVNPCIDCRILMLKAAKKIAGIGEKNKSSFIATGEVLGERPMTQNKEVLNFTEKKSQLAEYLLRPLSAKLFEKTIPEKLGWVKREKLLDISGRQRKKQIEMARKYKIKEYPTPSGGCLLTDLEFAKRIKKLFKISKQCAGSDIELLKLGRHFYCNFQYLNGGVKIIVGRNEEENKAMKKLAKNSDVLIEMKNYTGPLTLIRSYGKSMISEKVLKKAKKLTQYYSIKARNKRDVKFTATRPL